MLFRLLILLLSPLRPPLLHPFFPSNKLAALQARPSSKNFFAPLCLLSASAILLASNLQAQQPSSNLTPPPAPPTTPQTHTPPSTSQSEEDSLPLNLDVIFLRNGRTAEGSIAGMDAGVIRLQKIVITGQPPATITIPRSEVERIEFALTPELKEFLTPTSQPDLFAAARLWGFHEKFLPIPRSIAAKVGLRYANLLLQNPNPAIRSRSFEIFQNIEKNAWNSADRALAQSGRLRSLIATGRAAEAVSEAEALAEKNEDPAIQIESKLILASAAESELRNLETKNPRWQEDKFIRPERDRLYNRALDFYLFPYLFFGTEIESASQGLWYAVQLYQHNGELPQAREAARDLVTIYPESPYAQKASRFLESLPKEIQQEDYETHAQNAIP
ncbi:MAG: hypothetical protein NZL93_01090 [Chthoniobacterales bacterium]|nr:hypothetical protein [Chthoniobacterales bacterium]